ncbi:hypothetical protein [Dyadobacter sp. CY347]|uniref:hypothetical protein n=1 Tax=Dyadobacter sp. CY347 TaxID=2909336 RepID=UPI001F2B9015|nr:hypothetical protein [Dyadobacter sp. CY347]MCF2487897.1 hypothetical protein [Dyadobacter sp. CY347]
MRSTIKFLMISILTILTANGCKRGDDLFAGGPLSTHLNGTWNLEKILTPTRTLTGSQIGYNEKLVQVHEGDDDVDKVYRNDTLYAKHIWARTPGVITNDKKKTVLMSYRAGLKRFFKIAKQSGKPSTLTASDYLKEVGTAGDTVTFFYSQPIPR